MELPAFIPSISGYSPAYFPAKLKPHLPGKLFGAPARMLPATVNASIAARNVRLRENFAFTVSAGLGGKGDRETGLELQNGNGRWVHFVGIGGCGLSALAKLALKRGFQVSGSDIARSSFMDGLCQEGAHLCIGHSASNIQRDNGLIYPDSVVVSSAIPLDNSEVLHAKSVGVPVYKRDYWLGKLTENHNLIAVSGSHGKSTTASMLAYVLKAMGDDITALIGAHVPQFPEGNIIAGNGQNFVLEADEYDGCFLGVSPYIAVVTNLDWEHVDQFPDEDAVETTFRRFLKQIKTGGHLILFGDRISCKYNTVQVRVLCLAVGKELSDQINQEFYEGLPVADISLQIPGVYNVLNSMAVIATIEALFGDQIRIIDLVNRAKSHLRNFAGVSRRFEKVGSVCGCDIYDDYAHHPTEIRAVLQAARAVFPFKTLTVVFQPHTYSRLAALIDNFATALRGADRVVVTAVYAAREKDVWGVSGRDLASRLSGIESEYVPFLDNVVDKLVQEISEDPHREILVFTLGAGDITTLGPKLLSRLKSVKHAKFELLKMREPIPEC
ncbi:hypothetical protein CRG98_016186 [Punica granatum]|uniref:UDP-N-acetylmuramate--L-alanine ligase n=1 Tax=Punica granatum TaxID=22663 RepID=A0A2I0K4P8_PUNGR|nr:hypothetical protein CRG98_016186 [Punica granatum]